MRERDKTEKEILTEKTIREDIDTHLYQCAGFIKMTNAFGEGA